MKFLIFSCVCELWNYITGSYIKGVILLLKLQQSFSSFWGLKESQQLISGLLLILWQVVLVPAWVVVCASIVAVLYSIVFAGLLLRLPDVNPERRRTSLNSAIAYTCLVAPLLCFLVRVTEQIMLFKINILMIALLGEKIAKWSNISSIWWNTMFI